MIYLCKGMVWGVDWIHLVGVGVGIKKNQGGQSQCIILTFKANL